MTAMAFDAQLYEERQIELIAPHRRKRKRPPTQDRRTLRRYRRRWKAERLFAWTENFSLYDLLNDGRQRYFLPEVNSSADILDSIVTDFIEAGFIFGDINKKTTAG